MADIRIGTSGWLYPPWRGTFYPKDLPQRRELEYLSRKVNSIELNGSFYSLQRPESYRGWVAQTPEDFVFAVKGSRFITHMKMLRDFEIPLANFLASGVLALEAKFGPLLWQLPPRMRFDPERIDAFLRHLPRDTSAAATLATQHDERLAGRELTKAAKKRPLRHAMEVRHDSFDNPEFYAILREHNVALVVADTANTFPYLEQLTADFVYIRLHGDEELYASGYTDQALTRWAEKIRGWAGDGLDIYAYFDNDIKVKAPGDAMHLAELLAT